MNDHAITSSAAESEKSTEPLKYPCSLQQMRFWANEHIRPGDLTQNAAFRWRLDGEPSLERSIGLSDAYSAA
jgi:hypothetical protein